MKASILKSIEKYYVNHWSQLFSYWCISYCISSMEICFRATYMTLCWKKLDSCTSVFICQHQLEKIHIPQSWNTKVQCPGVFNEALLGVIVRELLVRIFKTQVKCQYFTVFNEIGDVKCEFIDTYRPFSYWCISCYITSTKRCFVQCTWYHVD